MDWLFLKLADAIGLKIDQVRYVTLFFLSIPLAYVFRVVLHYKYTSCTTRHLFSMLFGILFCWLCFKWQTLILIGFILFGYCLLLMLPPSSVHIYSLIYALTGVGIGHIYRMYIDYGGYSLDFTGPLMMLVQRVSYVASSYHDGTYNKENLNADQQNQKITAVPTLLEYFSYNFSFLSILAGPSVTYKEYDDFITGKNITCCQQELTNEPNPLLPMGKKFISAVVFMLLFALNGNRLDKSLVLDPDLQVHTRFINIVIFCFIIRCQYYFTFLIVESVCNAGGLGFNGLDDKGNEKWDLAQGIDIINFEFGLNVREQSIAWNKTTAAWIRRVVYDRSNSVLASYCVSALWHGFYPGYYVCFFFIAAVTLAGRKLRRLLWHHFQQPYILKIIYDIMSIASTDFCKDLAEMSFVLLLVNDIYIIWRYYYFFPLIVLPVILLIPVKKKNTLKDKQK